MRVHIAGALAGLLLAGACERRDRFAAPDTTSAPTVASLPPRTAYLTVSDLSPKPGATIVVAGTITVGSDLSLGSYRVRLGYDSTRLHFIEEIPSPGALRVVNPQAGDIIVAGAASGGSADGRLFAIRLRVDDAAAVNSLVLRIDELNDVEFRNQKETVTRASKLMLDRALANAGGPASRAAVAVGPTLPPTAVPALDSITPRSGPMETERVTDVTLYGRGFAARDNLVLFGGARVAGLMSEAGGTVLRFPAPSIRVRPGSIKVRVNNGTGESNAVIFVVKEEGR